MKTARVTFLLELFDGNTFSAPTVVQDHDSTFVARIEPYVGCQVIGEPKVEIDEHQRCAISSGQLRAALQAMRDRGGRFADTLAELIEVADSANTERLLDTFHDLIWNHVPVDEVRP